MSVGQAESVGGACGMPSRQWIARLKICWEVGTEVEIWALGACGKRRETGGLGQSPEVA